MHYVVAMSLFCSEIISNTEHHIRIVELLLQSDRWGEKLPDCIVAPGLCHALLCCGLSLTVSTKFHSS